MLWEVSLKWTFLVSFKTLYNFQTKHWLLQRSNCMSFILIFTCYCRCLEPVPNMWCTVNYELHLLYRKCWVKFCCWMNIWHRWMNIWHHWMNVKLWINIQNCWMDWSWYWINLRIQKSIHLQHDLLFLWIGIQITVWMWIKISVNMNVCKVFKFCTISLVIHM